MAAAALLFLTSNAVENGERWFLSIVYKSASDWLRRSLTRPAWCCSIAMCNGVLFSTSLGFISAPCSRRVAATCSNPHWAHMWRGVLLSSSNPLRELLTSQPLRIRKQADISSFASNARCRRVWVVPSGPFSQWSVSTPYRTKIEAKSSFLDSNASHRGQESPGASSILAPRRQRASKTEGRFFLMQSTNGDSPVWIFAWISAPFSSRKRAARSSPRNIK